jgi:hypothetical protein
LIFFKSFPHSVDAEAGNYKNDEFELMIVAGFWQSNSPVTRKVFALGAPNAMAAVSLAARFLSHPPPQLRK